MDGGIMGGGITAMVAIPTADGTDTVMTKVEASSNKNCQEAVKLLRNEKWEESAKKAEDALVDSAKDHKAHFAAGVGYEMARKFDRALEHYEQANMIDNPPPRYDEARRRVKKKLSK